MSKNLTRKGIAFGAMVALGTSLFAGAPAQAAGEVTLEVSAGTGNATILGETFTLKASLGALVPSSSNAKLKFAVTNSSAAALTYSPDNGPASPNAFVDGTDASAATGTSAGASDVVYDSQANPTSVQTLGISTSATDATSVSVVAFLDSDNGDDLDAGEFQSAAYTINFVKAADAGITTTWSAQLGDTKAKAVIKSSVVNVAQIANGHLGVQFGKYVSGTKTTIDGSTGTYGTLTNAGATPIDAALETTDKVSQEATDASVTALTAGTFVAQAIWRNGGSGVWVKVGTEVSFGLTAAEAVVATGKTVYEVVATENVTSAGVVRAAYKGDVTYQVTVRDTDKKVLAGRTVRLTTGSISSGTFKVNGVTAASTTSYDAVTDSTGVAKFAVTSSTAVNGNTFVAGALTVEGVSIAANATDLAWTTASYTAEEKAVFGSSDFKRGVDGSSTTLEFVVVDQWKKALSSADYRLKATMSSRTVSVVTDTIADGSASFTITDGALNADQTTVALSFEELVSGTWGAASTITVPSITSRVFYWYSQTDKITLNADGASNADLAATYAVERTVAVDTRLSNTDKTVLTTSSPDEQVTITGTVANATTAAAKEGAKVTVSGDSSILFNVGDTYAFGSLTFFDADGTLAINAYSNKVQTDSVVTVTSNGVAKTVKISFTGPTAASTVTSIKATYSANVLPGSAARVVFTAVDTYGNTVALGTNDDDITITTTGAGYLVTTPATFTDGVATLTLITAPADSGVVTIKVAAALAAGTTDDLSSTASITLGAAPATAATAAIAGSTKRFFVSVSNNTAAKNVVVKVAGKTVATLKGAAAKKTYTVKATKGSKKVTVYVGGKLIATKTVSVK